MWNRKVHRNHITSSRIDQEIVSRIDHEAVIVEILRNCEEWLVRYRATYWRARSLQSHTEFQLYDRAYVVGRLSNILLIQPMSDNSVSST